LARVFIPFQLRKLAGGNSEIDITAVTLGELIDELDKKFPGMKEKLVEGEKIKPGLAAVVGYVATRQGLRQKLEPDVEVHFVPAVSGG
jgi:molybdopterin converting factor small subunit|tara:strand:+ start:1451 stop:1714 length:264 start_codon:yes stop_codon:yes gene_type:complete